MLKTLLRWFMPQVFYLGGGGSTSTQKFEPPDYTVQPWKDYLGNAQNIAANPGALAPYSGQTVADLSPMTNNGLQMMSDFATQGTPERTTTGQVVQNVGQGAMNPYAAMTNSYTGAANPYMGDNPYLSSMIDTSNAKIANQYKTGTAAQNDAAFARSGAFGGSAWTDQTSRNQQDLLGALSANTNTLLKGNYDQSAQLAESGLNRNAGLQESDLSRAAQGWQAGQQNALGAGQLGLGQQGADQSAIQAMITSGQIPQQYQQALLQAAQQYYQQGQQVPFTLSDYLGSALSRTSGSGGTQTFIGAPMSGITGLLGGAALGYGAFGGP